MRSAEYDALVEREREACRELRRARNRIEELGWQYEELMERRKEVRELKESLAKAVNTLRFYGDEYNWKETYYGYNTMKDNDCGDEARKTLEELGEKGE